MSIKLSYSDFFEDEENNLAFSNVLFDVVKNKSFLSLILEKDNVLIATEQYCSTIKSHIKLHGKWRSSLLQGEYNTVSTLVLSPLLFQIQEIYMPHNSIFTLKKPNQTIANFFMINLFFAAARREISIFSDIEDLQVAKENRNNMLMQYLKVLKANLKSSDFNIPNICE
jgi:hypothetical protein